MRIGQPRFKAYGLGVVLSFFALDLIVSCQAQNAGVAPRGNRAVVDIAGRIVEEIWSQGDSDQNGSLNETEWSNQARVWFEGVDWDGEGKVAREDFLVRFEEWVPWDRGGEARRLPGGLVRSRFLGFWVLLDLDADEWVTRSEFLAFFDQWWSQARSAKTGEGGDKNGLSEILRRELPRTNLGLATGKETQEPIPGLPSPPPSPILSPHQALGTLKVDPGFKVEIMASEPTIQDPISFSFDADGNLYVLELRAFMKDIDGTGELEPEGRVTLLHDENGDGFFDRSTPYLEGLVLPRSLLSTPQGLLYVANHQLWLARDDDRDGRADESVLVDPEYGRGNVEHAPNGLVPALDNWIYNARSPYRYRWQGKTLLRDSSELRGQWGITQDDYGRLLYNVNNSQLLGDFAPPGSMGRNPHYPSSAGLNLFVATDQRVFPLRMNTAVNRGYLPEVLDPEGRLYVFASSCSPLVYRGDQFPEEFRGNAFVCDPSANLIKRNLLFDGDLTLSSRFAYPDREFLASTDERFRPVFQSNAPDGTLWVADFYRGIVQYGLFMTSYLRRETLERGLDRGIHYGRIYRIVNAENPVRNGPDLGPMRPEEWVTFLGDPNGWVRDMAQRLLVEARDRSVVPDLVERLSSGSAGALEKIHILWVLEGLYWDGMEESLSVGPGEMRVMKEGGRGHAPEIPKEVFQSCLAAIGDCDAKVQVTALRVCESLMSKDIFKKDLVAKQLLKRQEAWESEVLFQAVLTAGELEKEDRFSFFKRVVLGGTLPFLIREGLMSGMQGLEGDFLRFLLDEESWEEKGAGRAAILRALASAIWKEGDEKRVEEALEWAMGLKSGKDGGWRRNAVLAGMAMSDRGRETKPIHFKDKSEVVTRLESLSEQPFRGYWDRLRTQITWPGHEVDVAPLELTVKVELSEVDQGTLRNGQTLFLQVCAGCHGIQGEGIRPLAPPLVGSQWVSGSPKRLARIVLGGMKGPLTVEGRLYEPPDILPEMPSVSVLGDEELASILSYIRHRWGHQAGMVRSALLSEIRREVEGREGAFVEDELLFLD